MNVHVFQLLGMNAGFDSPKMVIEEEGQQLCSVSDTRKEQETHAKCLKVHWDQLGFKSFPLHSSLGLLLFAYLPCLNY